MIIGTEEVYLVQDNGGVPTILAAGSAQGASGVSLLSLRFKNGVHFSATTRQHLIGFSYRMCVLNAAEPDEHLHKMYKQKRLQFVRPESTAPQMPKTT
jgi:hypothetical protein